MPGAVYYMVAPNREAALSSPYLEAFLSKGTEVLLGYSPADEIVMRMLLMYKVRYNPRPEGHKAGIGCGLVQFSVSMLYAH